MNKNGSKIWAQIRNQDTKAATQKRQSNADAFAMKIGEIIHNEVIPYYSGSGEFGMKQTARYLNLHEIPTRNGGKWTATQVIRVFKRLEAIQKKTVD